MLNRNLSICMLFSSVEEAVQQHNICGGRQLKPLDTLTSSGHLELEVWFQLAGLTEPNGSSCSHSIHSALQYTGSHFENKGVLSAEGSCSPEAVLPLAGRLLCIPGRHFCYSMHSVQPHVVHFKALLKSRTLKSLLSLLFRKGLHEWYLSAHKAPDSPSERIFESCCNQQSKIRALSYFTSSWRDWVV